MVTSKKSKKTQYGIIMELSEKSGIPIAKVKEILENQANMAVNELKTAGSFILPGIGILELKTTPARKGRNPKTGQSIQISEKKRVRLKGKQNFCEALQDEW